VTAGGTATGSAASNSGGLLPGFRIAAEDNEDAI
jgi:hypothetical protein